LSTSAGGEEERGGKNYNESPRLHLHKRVKEGKKQRVRKKKEGGGGGSDV